ncbi:cell division protein ZipA [Caviibacterium pharyngocola]|uniref:Cell division protein ZipA n=1 Tax=Caviibacterium pharyngocola TaxID=28159 RepID=A0A2M8RXP2_9PAST|nr:cell division protein ZipA [Caviibacterium pharyngocola]PJG83646.1 cell division protein ZipA [Caviibacterium pharyngocola]
MDLNTILIILGVIALVILVAHGLWANRREKSQYFQNANTFTKDARVRQPQENLRQDPIAVSPEPVSLQPQPIEPPQPTQQSLNFDDVQYQTQAPDANQNLEQAVSRIKISLPNAPQASAASVEPAVYTQAPQDLTRATIADLEANLDENEGINSSSAFLREQLAEAAQHSAHIEPEPQAETTISAAETATESETQAEKSFIMLYVVAAENREFNGANLAQVLDDLGFIFGAQQIYHRHLDLSVASPILFSAANIQQPGTFDPYNMADFYTVGIALFMQLPSHGSDLANLRMMIRAAKTIAEELNGFVLTDQQEIFDEQAEKAYLSRVA